MFDTSIVGAAIFPYYLMDGLRFEKFFCIQRGAEASDLAFSLGLVWEIMVFEGNRALIGRGPTFNKTTKFNDVNTERTATLRRKSHSAGADFLAIIKLVTVFTMITAPTIVLAQGCDGDTSSLICRMEALHLENRRLIEEGTYVRDAVAQSICASYPFQPGNWLRAVWRPDGLPSDGSLLNTETWTGTHQTEKMTCEDICSQAIRHPEAGQEFETRGLRDGIGAPENAMQCIGALHIYPANNPSPAMGGNVSSAADVLGYKIFVYGGCGENGANVCCCATCFGERCEE